MDEKILLMSRTNIRNADMIYDSSYGAYTKN